MSTKRRSLFDFGEEAAAGTSKYPENDKTEREDSELSEEELRQRLIAETEKYMVAIEEIFQSKIPSDNEITKRLQEKMKTIELRPEQTEFLDYLKNLYERYVTETGKFLAKVAVQREEMDLINKQLDKYERMLPDK